jgi:CheY-like chemotaxis protein
VLTLRPHPHDWLTRLKGFTASDGPAPPVRNSPLKDLVLTDVVMPEMSGPELVQRLQLPATTKVRYMSGYADPQRRAQALEPGATLLEKPFTAAQLLRHVREALDNAVVPEH